MNIKLQKATKKQLLDILELIYQRSRDFYACHWDVQEFLNKEQKAELCDTAGKLIMNILDWSDGYKFEDAIKCREMLEKERAEKW